MYDEGYQRWRASARHLALFGEGLPDSIQPFSFVPMQGMEFVSSLLALSPGSTLVDFCIRDRIGVDSSKVAVADAASRQDLFPGLASARFVVADVADTGLPSGCADAVVSIDVLQLVPDPVAMVREITRVLKPGGRVVVTTWENTGAEVERFPSDIPGLFTEMSDVEVYDRPEWLPRQYAIYDAAVEADDGTDPAIADLAKEAKMIEPLRENSRRLVVTASRR